MASLKKSVVVIQKVRILPRAKPSQLSWSSEFICPIWVGRLADPTTRKGCKESLD